MYAVTEMKQFCLLWNKYVYVPLLTHKLHMHILAIGDTSITDSLNVTIYFRIIWCT